MRSTKATAALERLKRRCEDARYSMVRTADGRFYLTRVTALGRSEKLSNAMELDDFVTFLNAMNAEPPKKASKLDVAFEKQLKKS